MAIGKTKKDPDVSGKTKQSFSERVFANTVPFVTDHLNAASGIQIPVILVRGERVISG